MSESENSVQDIHNRNIILLDPKSSHKETMDRSRESATASTAARSQQKHNFGTGFQSTKERIKA